MAEMAQTAEHLIIIGRGRLIADTTVAEVLAEASHGAAVRVRTPQATVLAEALAHRGAHIDSVEPGLLEIHGLTSADVGEAAARAGVVLHELVAGRASLEDAFMRMTGGAVEYHAGALTCPDDDTVLTEAAA
jgi:ABC-2 type transport system ATP-binding protein